MICPIGKRPALLIGTHHQVIGYDTTWIREAISRAAVSAGRSDFPCVDDICIGIIHYLEHSCPLSLLPIEDLYIRIERMLRRIQCDAIADHLTVISPPITISLANTMRDLDFAFELGFFQQLNCELEELTTYGVEQIKITDIRDTVLMLHQSKRWTRKCDALAADILGFIKNYNSKYSEPTRSVHLVLETST